MASDGGKIKSKRRQAASKPYDRNLTLFGKLRKSVKDLLIPSWLSGSYQQSERQGTGDACQVEQASSLSAVESNNFSSGIQLLNRPGDGLVSVDQTPSYIDVTKEYGEPNVAALSGHGEGTSINLGEPYRDIHHVGKVPSLSSDKQDGQWDSKKSDMLSASKLTGVQLRETHRETVDPTRLRMSESYLNEEDDHNTELTGVHTIMTSTRVHNQSLDVSHSVTKRQRLWSPESDMRGKHLMSPVTDKSAFNSILLGSQSDSAMFGDSFNKSLFYPGKTRFGGASAERRTSLNTSLPYQSSLPLRKQVRAHNMSSKIQATTSATAQRILETLDRMSTPLGDAKKIPVTADSPNDSVLTFTPSSYRRISFHNGRPMTRPLQLPSRGPPTSQHQALAQAVIARNRHRSGIVDKRQTSAVEDDDYVCMPTCQQSGLADGIKLRVSEETGSCAGQQSGVTGKMKVKRFSQHISNVGADNDEVIEAPNLRTDFTLPVSNMGPISLQPGKSQTITEANIPSTGQSVPLKFTFSAPIDEKRQGHSKISGPADKNFKFTSPIKTSQSKTSAAGAEGESKTCQEPAVGASSGMPQWASSAAFTASVPAWGSTAPKPKVASPDIGGTSSSFKSYSKWGGFDKQGESSAASDTSAGFSLAPAASLMTGSVMDVLGGAKSSAPGTDDLMAKFKKAAGSWECDACMLVNKPETNKCICCETARPGSKTTQFSSGLTTAASSSSNLATSSPTNTDSFKTSVKTLAATSVCDMSTLSKNSQGGTFTASETAKPGAKQPQNGTENSLSSMFKKPAGTWECDTCMVQNTAGSLRCIACDSSKPGLQAAGIVSKAPTTSSVSSALTISPAGGFVFNTAAMTTTTSGSGGFKFGNATSSSTSSTSQPAATGFIFGQTTSANKEASSKSLTGSITSTPLTGGFKFGATSPEGDSGGTASGTSSFGVTNSGSGLVFGNSSSSILPAKTGDSVLGFKGGEAPKNSISNIVTTTANSQSNLSNNGIPSTDFNKSNSFVGSQFGPVLSSNISTPTASSGILQSGTQLDSKDNTTKLSHQQVNVALAPSSTAAPSFMAIAPQASGSLASKPASTLFQFGVPSVAPESNIGLGMGNSLSSNKPIVNGGFGTSFEMQTMKEDTKPTSLDTSKSFGNFTFGTSTPGLASFGQVPASTTESTSGTISSQVSQSSKRQVDFGEKDHSSAKKPFNFGTGVSEPSSNGLFTFGGSTAGSSTGGFMFNSTSNPSVTQTGGPVPGGGFSFSGAPSHQGFNFSFKAQDSGAKPSFEAPANKGSMAFNPTPNFNFAAAPQQSSLFQFGAKPVENASGVFAFGSAQPSSVSTGYSGYQAPAGMGSVGGFSIGASESGRKIKKAMRRNKK